MMLFDLFVRLFGVAVIAKLFEFDFSLYFLLVFASPIGLACLLVLQLYESFL